MTATETTADIAPHFPCTQIKHPDGSTLCIDQRGFAYTVDQRRVPEFDALPADRCSECGRPKA